MEIKQTNILLGNTSSSSSSSSSSREYFHIPFWSKVTSFVRIILYVLVALCRRM